MKTATQRRIASLSAALVLALLLCGCATSEVLEKDVGDSAVSATKSGRETTNSTSNVPSPTGTDSATVNEPELQVETKQEGASVERLVLVVDGQALPTTFESNEATNALVGMAPLELEMRDVNGNEKFATLNQDLPSSNYAPGRIEAGDLMLYGGDGIVLFYESFNSSYSYTRLGRVTDASALSALAGTSSIRVAFELR